MGYNLIIKPKAEKDLYNALEWYKDQNDNLPLKFMTIINNSLERIQKNPEHYQKRYFEIRILFTKKFPYGVYYTVEENSIYVHAILHTKQNPKTAQKRIK